MMKCNCDVCGKDTPVYTNRPSGGPGFPAPSRKVMDIDVCKECERKIIEHSKQNSLNEIAQSLVLGAFQDTV